MITFYSQRNTFLYGLNVDDGDDDDDDDSVGNILMLNLETRPAQLGFHGLINDYSKRLL